MNSKLPFFLLILTTFFSCNTANNSLPKEFNDDKTHFSIHYPANWTMDSATYSISENLENINDDFVEKINFGYEKLPIPFGAKIYATSVATTFKLLDSNFHQISLDTFIQPNFSAYQLLFSTQKNNIHFKNAVYVLLKDTNAFTIQCNATEQSFDAHLPIFKNIINNIKYK